MSDVNDHSGQHSPIDLDWLICLLQQPFLIRRMIGGEWDLWDDSENPDSILVDGVMPEVLVYRKDRMVVRADSAFLRSIEDEQIIEPLKLTERGRPNAFVVRVSGDPFDQVRGARAVAGTLAPDAELALDEFSLAHVFCYFSHSSWLSHSTWLDGERNELVQNKTGEGLTPLDPGAIFGDPTLKIGVIDSGVDTQHRWHQSLVAGNLEPGKDHDHGVVYGHGTGVCGVLRQGAPNSEIWVRRPQQHDCWYLEELDIIRLIGDMEAEGCEILNLSFGGATVGTVPALRKRLAAFAAGGGHVVAAAGNREPPQAQAPIFPAAWPEVIAVAAVKEAGGYHTWSNGDDEGNNGLKWVDETVVVKDRSIPGGPDAQVIWTSYPGGRFAAWQGTSFLAPMIAAKLALGSPLNWKDPHDLDRV